MSWSDQMGEGVDRLAKEAEKLFGQFKTRIDQLQKEQSLDKLARRLGYMEFDAHRGRPVDASAKAELLAEMMRHEDELHQAGMAPAGGEAAGAGGEASGSGASAGVVSPVGASAGAAPVQRPTAPSPGTDLAEAARLAQAAADAEALIAEEAAAAAAAAQRAQRLAAAGGAPLSAAVYANAESLARAAAEAEAALAQEAEEAAKAALEAQRLADKAGSPPSAAAFSNAETLARAAEEAKALAAEGGGVEPGTYAGEAERLAQAAEQAVSPSEDEQA
jgi:hypothetical protein